MSYCRWSSDNWRCDLYCYADVSGGYTTHVACNRIVGEVPKVDFAAFMRKEITPEEYTRQHRAQMAWLDTCKRAPIGLPYDGQSFNDPTLEAFLARLLHLREVGYKFPDYVLETVREELAEEQQPGKGVAP